MKNLIIFLLFILAIPFFGICQSFNQFNFIYKFQKNEYDSKTNMFTKDMVVDSSVTFIIKFTRKELKIIYQKLQEIGFWNYPETYKYQNADSTNDIIGMVEPCFGYSMMVNSKNYTKKVRWSDCIVGKASKDRLYEKLKGLDSLIFKIISQKKAYKDSPPLRSGYL